MEWRDFSHTCGRGGIPGVLPVGERDPKVGDPELLGRTGALSRQMVRNMLDRDHENKYS